jgi:hypothetical protein
MKYKFVFCLAIGSLAWSSFPLILAQNNEFGKYAMFGKTAKRAEAAGPVVTKLPLKLESRTRIGLVGNT